MNDNLQTELKNLIESGSSSNPAVNTLINDYTQYHAVLVVAGGLLVLIFVLLSIYFWTQWKRIPNTAERKWTFEKKTYFAFGALSVIVGLLFALIVAMNASNVFDPWHGFSLLVDELGIPEVGTQMDTRYQEFNSWVQSGSVNVPSIIQSNINERIEFHTTRALVAGVLLGVFVALSMSIWRTLIKRSRVLEAKWRLKESALLVGGFATVSLSLLMIVIVFANSQGAFAPITLTMLYG